MAASLTEVPDARGSREDMLTLIGSDLRAERRLDRQRRAERLSAIGERTAQFAHQVRTPLASAMLCAGQLEASDAKQQRALAGVKARLDDLGRMVNDMLGFAAGATPSAEPVNVRSLCDNVQRAIAPQLGADLQLIIDVPGPDWTLTGNQGALTGALLNLVNNAIEAVDHAGEIMLKARVIDTQLHLSVVDAGEGIPPTALPRLFEPFFTTRSHGTGLGLAVVEAVVAAHRGAITVETSSDGTTVTLKLPLPGAALAESAND